MTLHIDGEDSRRARRTLNLLLFLVNCVRLLSIGITLFEGPVILYIVNYETIREAAIKVKQMNCKPVAMIHYLKLIKITLNVRILYVVWYKLMQNLRTGKYGTIKNKVID